MKMLSLRKQPTTLLILISLGVFMLALAGCSEKDVLSPTKDTSLDFDNTQFLAPSSQGEYESYHRGAGNFAMPGNPQSVPNDMMGGGMMNGGMMGGGMMGGMMGWGGWGWNFDEEGLTPLTIDQAIEAAQEYLAAIGNPDLALAEVMEFDNPKAEGVGERSEHFYAEVYETSTGIGAFELLIDLYTGRVRPEPGPNMMWNTKYGHMRWRPRTVRQAMSVTAEKAIEKAQKFLDARLPGTEVAEEADTFYGYYTIHVLNEEENIYGMLSVNGYTGQVWYHTWHGEFVGIKELE
jgi:hypothetical protein